MYVSVNHFTNTMYELSQIIFKYFKLKSQVYY